MMTSLMILCALGQGQAQTGNASAGLVSKMLAYYSNAQTLTGHIRLTQTADNVGGTLDTTIQYERPSKLYVRQVLQVGAQPQQVKCLVVSDGVHFSYDKPNNLLNSETRLVEAVRPNPKDPKGISQDIGMIYAAAAESVTDRSMPLDVAVGRLDDLRFDRGQWATLADAGPTKVGDKDVELIQGDWRAYETAPVTGTYQMFLAADGSLVRYVLRGTVMATDPQTNRQVGIHEITSTWDVNLLVNGTPEQSLFKLPR